MFNLNIKYKMKYTQVFFLLLIFNITYSQCKKESDSIRWSKEVKLEWKDFKGAVPFGDIGNKKAISSLEILASGIDFYEDSIPVFKIETYFYKKGSWAILKTDDVLLHEQGHFDITEIYARKLRKHYLELNKQKVTDISKYSQVYEDINKEMDIVHFNYDKEVNFIPENLEIWYKKIARELKELEKYAL